MSHAKLGVHFKVKRDMKISELAYRAGVVSSAIRYYERAVLLPKAARDGNGYRSDDVAAPDRIHFIWIGQKLGFTLQAMRGMRDVATACGVTQRDRADALVSA